MKTCVREYYKDTTKARALTSVVCGDYNSDDDTITFVFPRPFLLTAFVTESDVPGAPPPEYPNSLISLLPTATQNTYRNMLINIFIAFAFDTAIPQGTSAGNDAYVSGNFSEYMFKYLANGTANANYNSLIAMVNEVAKFWNDEQTTPVPSTLKQRLRELERWLFTNGRIELYIPGGVYQILHATDGTNTAPYATDLIAFMTAESNAICFRTVELDLVGCLSDIITNGQFPPPAVPLNTLNYDPGIPDAILWT